MGGSPQKPDNGRFQYKHSIRNAVSKNAWIFWVFGCPKFPKWGGAHKSQKMVDFSINTQLETPFPGTPGFFEFLAVPSPPNVGKPTRATKLRRILCFLLPKPQNRDFFVVLVKFPWILSGET